MLKFQMGLIALLIACVAFISCDQLVEILTPAPPEEDMPDDMMPTDDMLAGLPMYISMYTSWLPKVTYPEATETGLAHGEGARTIYINDVGAMALEDEDLTAYPAGTIIVKEIMDDANTFIQKVATMKKTDDSRHNGWTYKNMPVLMKTLTTPRLGGMDFQMQLRGVMPATLQLPWTVSLSISQWVTRRPMIAQCPMTARWKTT